MYFGPVDGRGEGLGRKVVGREGMKRKEERER